MTSYGHVTLSVRMTGQRLMLMCRDASGRICASYGVWAARIVRDACDGSSGYLMVLSRPSSPCYTRVRIGPCDYRVGEILIASTGVCVDADTCRGLPVVVLYPKC